MAVKILVPVGEWDFESGQKGVEVYSGYDISGNEVFKVEVDGKVKKYFSGEWAWADADRYAYDLILPRVYGY